MQRSISGYVEPAAAKQGAVQVSWFKWANRSALCFNFRSTEMCKPAPLKTRGVLPLSGVRAHSQSLSGIWFPVVTLTVKSFQRKHVICWWKCFSGLALPWVKLMQVSYMDSWWWEAEEEMHQSMIKEKKKRQLEVKLQITLVGRHRNKSPQGDSHPWGFLSHWKERKTKKGSCMPLLSLCLPLPPNPVSFGCCYGSFMIYPPQHTCSYRDIKLALVCTTSHGAPFPTQWLTLSW